MIDFHSHILPQIDDGSKSIEETVEMLHRMKQQGIETVVATPHFYASHDDLQAFLTRRERARTKLCSVIDNDMPKVVLGAEVAYFRGMSQVESLQELVIEGTNAILVELPMAKWNDSVYRELAQIYEEQGLIPIVAHLDRYLTPFNTHGIVKKMAQLPVLVQANAEFFLEKSTARKAKKMLADDMIHLLGSDTHNLTDRAPNLGEAVRVIEESLGFDAIERIRAWQNKIFSL